MSGSWRRLAIMIAMLLPMIGVPTANAAEYLIKVDGITGEVSRPEIIGAKPSEKDNKRYEQLIFEPGDQVKVQVVRANLIKYGYRITLDKKEVLVVHHVIIGGPTVTDADTAADLLRGESVDKVAASMDVDPALIAEYTRVAKALRSVNRRLADLQSTVRDTESEISGMMCSPGNGWPARLVEVRSDVYCALTGKGRDTAAGCVKKVSDLTVPAKCAETALRSSLGDIEDALAALAATLAVTKHADDDTGFASFQSAVNGLQTSVGNSRTAANALQQTVDRWVEVILSRPDATLSNTFLIEDISQRYTVGAHRFDAKNPPSEKKETDTAEEEQGEAKGGPVETIANVVFEGHAFSRLNFALGLANAYRSHNDTFEIVKSVAADKTVTAHVERKSHDTIETKPIASLGVYLFRRVDGTDMKRRPAPMLSVGVEVAESPDYFAGFGFDWPSGLTVSAGVTVYQKTQLAPGWSVGQTVPLNSEGTPIITAPVTNTSTALAPYLAIQFRPTIFRAFSKLFKTGS